MNHADRAHALLSASGAHRWMNCTPSAVLESKFPDTTSEAAKEGTLAHELAEAKLQNYVNTKEFSKRKLTNRIKKLKENELWQNEMDGFTDDYMDFIRREALRFEATPYVAIEEKLNLETYVPGGFGTADCIMIGGGTIEIIDFKYGKGVPVAAEENPQLMLYALGAHEKYNFLYGFSEVRLSIVQPRIGNNSTWTLSLDDLLAFGEKVKAAAAIAAEGGGEFHPGDWCRFCRAKAQCRARAEENVKLAFQTERKPELLTNDEIGRFLDQGEDVAKWLKDLQEYALAQCLGGKEVAGWKAVEGRGTRDWVDMDKAFEIIIASGTPQEMLWEKKPLTLAQVEKVVGKKEFAAEVGDYVVKKPGKPTLVRESDKRPAITNKISADEVFN